jgi:predicted regulator of Ras-like GTPase activity (Roadblock/LC7/MglB family)
MVFKNIQRIKAALPEVLHVAMFYNNGTIFQTTFEQNINIPKLGENLAELLNHIRRVYEICDLTFEAYKKLIFETEDVSIIILKLGEDSNLALFFKKEEDKELKLQPIKRYITRIEELIDMDKNELKFQELLTKENELKNLQDQLTPKERQIINLKDEIASKQIELDPKELDNLSKDLECLEADCKKLKEAIITKENELTKLREEFEKERKKEN